MVVLTENQIKNTLLFYKDYQTFLNFYFIKNNKSFQDDKKISLRMIEFLITYYSKQFKINYGIIKNKNNQNIDFLDYNNKNYENEKKKIQQKNYKLIHFNLNQSYTNQINYFHKKFFDPCCRNLKGKKFYLNFNNNLKLQTTLKQLIFFKWFFENFIFDWLLLNSNYNHVKKEMKNYEIEKKEIQEKSKEILLNLKSRTITLQFKKNKIHSKNDDCLIIQKNNENF